MKENRIRNIFQTTNHPEKNQTKEVNPHMYIPKAYNSQILNRLLTIMNFTSLIIYITIHGYTLFNSFILFCTMYVLMMN